MYSEVIALHTHHPPCGAPVIFDPYKQEFRNVNGGDVHVCDADGGTVVCECGEVILRSRFGWLYEVGPIGPRAHLCYAEIDRVERELAFERGSWRR